MNKYYYILKNSLLFNGISENELPSILNCLSAYKKEYSKNQFILHKGESVSSIGMVLKGNVHIIKEDYWGNRNIISIVLPGQLFAETYACIQQSILQVSVLSAEPTEILFLDIKRILTTCPSACDYHIRLIKNLMAILAQKNLLLNDKVTHMAERTTRKKLLSYLSSQSIKANKPSFLIPYNRQQLADYLSIDRSAMSAELCKMRDEGLIKFDKNHFTLKYNF
jgi:CRP-like cAMP-binding protein